MAVKIIQLVSHKDLLYALDDKGRVWVKHGTGYPWCLEMKGLDVFDRREERE